MSLERSELIKERYIECSQNGEINQGDEIEILQYLFNKLHMVGIAEAAKRAGMSYNGMKRRAESGREMVAVCGDVILVSKPII